MIQRVFSRINGSLGVVTLLLASLVFVSCSDQKHRLAFKVQPRDTFIVYFTGTENITSKSNTTETSRGNLELKLVYKFIVTSIDVEGNISFAVTVLRAQLPLFRAPLSKVLTGKSFSLRMAPDGLVIDFQGTDEMRQQIASALIMPKAFISPDGDSERTEWFRSMLMKEVSDAFLRDRFEKVFRIWPSIPVTTGDSWKRDDIVSPVKSVVDSTTFTVDAWEAGVATISTSTTFTSDGQDPAIRFNGSGTGELKIDAIGGFPKSFSYTERFEGSVTGFDEANVEITQINRMFVEFLRL